MDEAIQLLQTGKISDLSISDGLGFYCETANWFPDRNHTVLDWIYDAVWKQGVDPPQISVHHANESNQQPLNSKIRAINDLGEVIVAAQKLSEFAEDQNNELELPLRLRNIQELLTDWAQSHFDPSIPAVKQHFDKATRFVMDCAAHEVAEIRQVAISIWSISMWEKWWWHSIFEESDHSSEICNIACQALWDSEPAVRKVAISTVFHLKMHSHKGVLERLLELTGRTEPRSVKLQAIESIELLLCLARELTGEPTRIHEPLTLLGFWNLYLNRLVECLSENVIRFESDWYRTGICCGGYCVDALLHSAECYQDVVGKWLNQAQLESRVTLSEISAQFENSYRDLFCIIASYSAQPHPTAADCMGRQMLSYLVQCQDEGSLLSFMNDFPATRQDRRAWRKFCTIESDNSVASKPWTFYARYTDS